MVRLTTHVLDTAQGKPGVGVRITLCRFRMSGDTVVVEIFDTAVTNSDGRLDRPLINGTSEIGYTGTWQLEFAIGEYFAAQGIEAGTPPFLDDVIVRFAISDDEGHYHVPLLVSPWSYTTYRGS